MFSHRHLSFSATAHVQLPSPILFSFPLTLTRTLLTQPQTAMTVAPQAQRYKRTKLSSTDKQKRNQLLANLQETGEYER